MRPGELRFEAVNGTTLSDWLSFDAETRKLQIDAWNGEAGTHYFDVIAIDDDGLETRVPVRIVVKSNPAPWHNPALPGDADGNGRVEPRDALLIINRVARQTDRTVDLLARTRLYFYDVSGDNLITPLDALRVINHIARQRSANNPLVASEAYPTLAEDKPKTAITDAAISVLF